MPSTEYKIGNYSIEVPPNFALERFQKDHRLYDRFLPVLAKKINSDKIIVDIGANIGDTLFSIIDECKNPILCIEPSDVYFSYLENNIIKLPSKTSKRIKVIKELVGTGVLSGNLSHSDSGTASIKLSENNIYTKHVELDSFIENSSEVILVKVDTDGFDFDVINSAKKILRDSEPILFWENYVEEDFQMKGFNELYRLLENNGYNCICLFDNFGNIISEERNFNTAKNINAYLLTMAKHNCSRSFYYVDILASTEKNRTAVENAINEYKTTWIYK